LNFQELKQSALRVYGEIQLREGFNAGTVAAALRAADGKIYTGICLHLACGIGTCAEHAAVLEMLKAHQTHVLEIIAVGTDAAVLPPCGRCRELLLQISDKNLNTKIYLTETEAIELRELLPHHWLVSDGG
jgi:cytidine deaminase